MSQDKLDKCLDSIHRVELILTKMEADVHRNTDNIEVHIKRTNLLEKKLSKIYTVMLFGAGFALATAGPQLVSLLKVLL